MKENEVKLRSLEINGSRGSTTQKGGKKTDNPKWNFAQGSVEGIRQLAPFQTYEGYILDLFFLGYTEHMLPAQFQICIAPDRALFRSAPHPQATPLSKHHGPGESKQKLRFAWSPKANWIFFSEKDFCLLFTLMKSGNFRIRLIFIWVL